MRCDSFPSPWEDRLVEVWASPHEAGAGLAISDCGVLTARHVVEAAPGGGVVKVRVVSRARPPSEWVPARIVDGDPDWDLAVLMVEPGQESSGKWPTPTSPAPLGAMLGTRSQQGCEAVGFPDAEVQPDATGDPSRAVRQTEQVSGKLLPMGQVKPPIAPDAKLPQQWMPLDVESATPSDASGWGGMSGAGVVLADGRLTGVVVYVPQEHQVRRLYVVPLGPAVRASPSLVKALNEVHASGLAESLEQVRVLHRPPDLVPSEFYDRIDLLSGLLERLEQPSVHFVALTGDPGTGKTAVITDLLQQLSGPGAAFPISTFEYISTRGNRPVNVPTLIEVLAKAHPVASVRDRLLEHVCTSEESWWEKLDYVIRELNGCRVLIAVDDGERLLDRHGEIGDRPLRELVEYLSKHPDHAVQLLFVTSDKPKFRLRRFNPEDSLEIPARLPPKHGAEFLRSMGHAGVDHKWLRQLHELAGGQPRTLELVSCMLAELNGDAASLMRLMRGVRGDRMAQVLLDRIVGGLPESDAWVLRGLAVFGRPVPVEAVSRLLERDCGAAIARLSDRRLVRADEDAETRYLPPDEAEYLLHRIPLGEPSDRARTPRPLTKIALWDHAADYFAALAEDTSVLHVEDLGPHFGEIELRTRGGEYDRAFRLMNKIDDEYLATWGHHEALSQFRDLVAGHLSEAHDEVDNLVRLAYAMRRQEHYDSALEKLRGARRWNRDVRNDESPDAEDQYASNDLAITLEVAAVHFSTGQVTKAARLYESACKPLKLRDKVSEAKGHSGYGLCLTETAHFDEAIQNFKAGLVLIEHNQDDETAMLRAQLTLNLGVAQLYRGWPDDALATLQTARRLAFDLENRVLTARCMDAMALATIERYDGRAMTLAEQAAAEGVKTGSPELAREANGTLALIHLRREDTEHALAAANVAVEFGRTRRGVAGFAMRGIALLRSREPELAENAFLEAHVRASELLLQDRDNYRLHEFNGLALAGLALSTGSDHFVKLAAAAYRQARRRTQAPGVVQLCLLKLDALLLDVDDPEFDRIRAAARGRTSGASFP